MPVPNLKYEVIVNRGFLEKNNIKAPGGGEKVVQRVSFGPNGDLVSVTYHEPTTNHLRADSHRQN